MTNTLQSKAQTLQSILSEKNISINEHECMEVVSKMETKPTNSNIRILQLGESLTFKEMQETDFSVSVVIPMDMDTFFDGIDVVNDVASQTITGSDYALCDIGYEVFPYFYGTNTVAVKVTGYVDDLQSLSHLQDFEEEETEA